VITQQLIAEIHSLLFVEHCSQRAVARRLGVSRGSVQAVARGKYRLHPPLKRPTGEGFQPPQGRHLRCPGCGGKVQLPCLACYLRRKKEKENAEKPEDEG
jgi:hypothetical protein